MKGWLVLTIVLLVMAQSVSELGAKKREKLGISGQWTIKTTLKRCKEGNSKTFNIES